MVANLPHKVLVVGPSWVGDMVMAQALFKVIKQRRSDTVIDVLAPAWSRPLLARMPEVNRGIDMPAGHGQLMLAERYRLGRSLRDQYHQAILLPNSFKSAMIPAFAKIPLRTGWRGEMRFGLLNDTRVLDKQKYPLMVERFVALAYGVGAALPKNLPRPQLLINHDNATDLLRQYKLNRQRPILVLCPGAEFGPAKRWPEQHYAAVATEKIASGWQIWIMGSQKDRFVGESIRRLLSAQARHYTINLAGVTELADAIDLMSLAKVVISNDSGLMHIAAALQRPLVVVYGSTSPAFTPPLATDVRVESISVDCRPCFKRECPLLHMKCLNELYPRQVINSLEQLIEVEASK